MERVIERLKEWADLLRSSLWFIPTVFVVGSILLALGMIWIDGRVSRDVLLRLPRLFGAGAESSREMLAALAGSMITVVGITFSITVVAVSQASNQYSSRILRNFMRDRANQVVLGGLVGVFTYCLVVLRTIRGDEDIRFIPAVSVLLAFLLAIAAVGLLIFFIHHIAESLQASKLLERTSRETIEAVDHLFPGAPATEEHAEEHAEAWRLVDGHRWTPVPAKRSGYIQWIEYGTLLELAGERRTVVRVERGVGEFVVEGSPIVRVAEAVPGDRRLAESIAEAFVIRSDRSVAQDVEFGVRQIVDVALKALSPGINDATTAVNCVDHLSAVLSRLAVRDLGGPLRSIGGKARVITRGPTFPALLDTAFDEIRRNAAGNVNVLERMLAAIETIAAFTRSRPRLRALRRHVERIRDVAEGTIPAPYDRRDVVGRCDELLARLG